jgi:hypothetical protein
MSLGAIRVVSSPKRMTCDLQFLLELAAIYLIEKPVCLVSTIPATNASGEVLVETPPCARLITARARGPELQVAKQAESALTGG